MKLVNLHEASYHNSNRIVKWVVDMVKQDRDTLIKTDLAKEFPVNQFDEIKDQLTQIYGTPKDLSKIVNDRTQDFIWEIDDNITVELSTLLYNKPKNGVVAIWLDR